MAVKTKKQTNESILYIQDIDAKVLGIIEGSAQKVFIDGKEIDVVFVDEHEVVPVSAEEKKLYQNAAKLASKYESVFANTDKDYNRNLVGSKSNAYDNVFKKNATFSVKDNRSAQVSSPIVYKPTKDASTGGWFKKSKPESSLAYATDARYGDSKLSIKNETISQRELKTIQSILDKSKAGNGSSKVVSVKKSKGKKAPKKASKNRVTHE